MQPPNKHEKAFFLLSIAGLVVIAFIAGGAAVYYQWPPAGKITSALESADAWMESKREADEEAENDRLDADNKDPIGNRRVTWNEEKAEPGYTLLTVRKLEDVFLIDREGRVVYTWKLHPEKIVGKDLQGVNPRVYIYDAWAFPNGDLLVGYMLRGYTPYGVGVVKVDKHSNVLWTSIERNHHDIYYDTETKNIYALAHHFVKPETLGLSGLPKRVMDDTVLVLSENGKTLDAFSLLEAFTGTEFEPLLHYDVPDKAGWDTFHTNTVQRLDSETAKAFPMFKPGQILLSIRNMSALAVLDPESRKIVWMRFGPWRVQHDAQFLPNGHILLLDNMGYIDNGDRYSRVFEFTPGSAAIAWHFDGTKETPFFTSTHGRVQRLADGNTLINEANSGRLFEVTPKGEVVWDYRLPGRGGFDLSPITILTSARYRPEELPFLQEDGE